MDNLQMWKLSNLNLLHSSKEARTGCTRITCRDMRRFEGIRLALSIWRYLLSWSHGGRLSWGSAGSLHSTACHTTEKSTHFTAGVAHKCISSTTCGDSEWKEKRGDSDSDTNLSLMYKRHVQRFCLAILVLPRTELFYSTLTISSPLLSKNSLFFWPKPDTCCMSVIILLLYSPCQNENNKKNTKFKTDFL